jgi:hypothetical protein
MNSNIDVKEEEITMKKVYDKIIELRGTATFYTHYAPGVIRLFAGWFLSPKFGQPKNTFFLRYLCTAYYLSRLHREIYNILLKKKQIFMKLRGVEKEASGEGGGENRGTGEEEEQHFYNSFAQLKRCEEANFKEISRNLISAHKKLTKKQLVKKLKNIIKYGPKEDETLFYDNSEESTVKVSVDKDSKTD